MHSSLLEAQNPQITLETNTKNRLGGNFKGPFCSKMNGILHNSHPFFCVLNLKNNREREYSPWQHFNSVNQSRNWEQEELGSFAKSIQCFANYFY